MFPRSLLRLLSALLILVASTTALAGSKDKAATKKIDEAINEHYLATNFDKAEGILLGTIKACGSDCSGSVIGKAWMYVGIVRGSGKNDQGGAKDAFKQALAADPGVTFDDALATPDTKASFDAVKGGGGKPEEKPEEKPPEEKPKHPPISDEAPGEMDCQPKVKEVETRRPIPIACTSEEEIASAELRYKPFGAEDWKTVKMHKKGDYLLGEIPCTDTADAGTVKLYVRGKDRSGDTVDGWGNKRQPVEIKLVSKSDEEAPSYPDQDAPNRCAEKEECPPDFPGCKQGGGGRGNLPWGSPCQQDTQCEAGLACVNGSCETAAACTSNEDCAQGTCVSGTCQTGGGGTDEPGPTGPVIRNWVGIHGAYDLALVSGSEVCSRSSQANNGFACFFPGVSPATQYSFDSQPGFANRINGGIVPSTARVLVSYERVFGRNITGGLRAGYALLGGPAPQGGASFLPIHAELRGAYYIGRDPFGKAGLRPYVHVGGGMAQVDSKLEVTIRDCHLGRDSPSEGVDTLYDPGSPEYEACKTGQNEPPHRSLKLDAYKKLGQGFGAIGGGAVYAFQQNMGVQLNLNFMYMLPSSGIVIEPSLGFVMGFGH